MNWMSDVILPFLIVHRSQNSVTADLPVGLNVTFSADGGAAPPTMIEIDLVDRH